MTLSTSHRSKRALNCGCTCCSSVSLEARLRRPKHSSQKDGCNGDNVWRIQEGQIGVVVVVDDGACQDRFLCEYIESGCEVGQCSIRMMQYQARGERADEMEFTFANLGNIINAKFCWMSAALSSLYVLVIHVPGHCRTASANMWRICTGHSSILQAR